MKFINFFFAIILISILAFVGFAEDKKSFQDIFNITPLDNSSSLAVGNTTLSEGEKKSVKDLREFFANQPEHVRNEISAFREEVRQLKKKRQDLYDNLSDDSKNFLSQEKDKKTNLSDLARKEFYKKYSIKD